MIGWNFITIIVKIRTVYAFTWKQYKYIQQNPKTTKTKKVQNNNNTLPLVNKIVIIQNYLTVTIEYVLKQTIKTCITFKFVHHVYTTNLNVKYQ